MTQYSNRYNIASATSSTVSVKMLTVLVMSVMVSLVSAHSEMRCAKYDTASGQCSAAIRNAGAAFLQEAYLFTNGAPICQSAMSNPISASYSNGAGCPDYAPCPDPMGTYAPGERFTVMWYARNHAVADQDPATVYLYLSPKESATQGADVSQATMASNLICSGPYMNCGGVNQDTTPCTLTCTMPSNIAAGIYTFWWKWDWQGSMYTTCADINVSGSSGSSGSSSSSSSSSGQHSSTTKAPVTTSKLTTKAIQQATTGRTQSVTTSKAAVTTKAIQQVTTGRSQQSSSSSSTSTSTSGSNNGQMCYLPGTPNLNGKINGQSTCGKNAPRARCPDGQCCSQWGYCGPFRDSNGNYYEGGTIVSQALAMSLYCNKTSGDYRKVPCNSIISGVVASEALTKDGNGASLLNDGNQLRWIILLGLFGVLLSMWN